MLNPSYLIQSHHSIFYFRYPLGNKRVSVALHTRCPKEALRLAKFFFAPFIALRLACIRLFFP